MRSVRTITAALLATAVLAVSTTSASARWYHQRGPGPVLDWSAALSLGPQQLRPLRWQSSPEPRACLLRVIMARPHHHRRPTIRRRLAGIMAIMAHPQVITAAISPSLLRQGLKPKLTMEIAQSGAIPVPGQTCPKPCHAQCLCQNLSRERI